MTIVHVQVPIGLDVIIIGGGVSGMAAAATLSKAGKKVLVLEHNEGLGGGTSTVFIKGVEFSIGAFFLGEVGERKSILRTALDQVTDGQVDFVPIGSLQDKVYIGRDVREYERGSSQMHTGKLTDSWRTSMLPMPGEINCCSSKCSQNGSSGCPYFQNYFPCSPRLLKCLEDNP